MTYRPWFYDPSDCSALMGGISSRFNFFRNIGVLDNKADFLADQLYDLWSYSLDTSKAFDL